MSSAREREADDLDALDELGVDRVVFRPRFSGRRRSTKAHRLDADEPEEPACSHGGDGDLALGTIEEARLAGIDHPCRHEACFGESYSERRRRAVDGCPLCGREDVTDLRRHLPKCPKRRDYP